MLFFVFYLISASHLWQFPTDTSSPKVCSSSSSSAALGLPPLVRGLHTGRDQPAPSPPDPTRPQQGLQPRVRLQRRRRVVDPHQATQHQTRVFWVIPAQVEVGYVGKKKPCLLVHETTLQFSVMWNVEFWINDKKNCRFSIIST